MAMPPPLRCQQRALLLFAILNLHDSSCASAFSTRPHLYSSLLDRRLRVRAAAAANEGEQSPEDDLREGMTKALQSFQALSSDDKILDDRDGPMLMDRPESRWDTSSTTGEDASEEELEAALDYKEMLRELEESIGEEGGDDDTTTFWDENMKSWDGQSLIGTDDGDGDDEAELIPEPNPYADPDAVSLAGVSYQTVLYGLTLMFPPRDLGLRNAASRKNGYWEFVSRGEEPPKHLTYGEFDFNFFAELIDRARYYYRRIDGTEEDAAAGWEDKVFTDIGSGTGRLVLAAAALHPNLRLCRGVEILPGIHRAALRNLQRCRIRSEEVPEENDAELESPMATRQDWSLRAPKQSDEDWLQSFSGQFLEIQGQDDPLQSEKSLEEDEEEEGKEEEDEDDEEWRNPDAWASQLNENEENNGDEDEDDDDWRNPDDWGSRWGGLSGEDTRANICSKNESLSDDDKDAELALLENEKDHYYLKCPTLNQQRTPAPDDESEQSIPLAPVEFSCGSFEDPYEYIGDSDVVFIFSSCMSKGMMQSLGQAIGRQCKPGAIIITTEFTLPLVGVVSPMKDDESLPHGPYKLELIERVDGWCWLTGGESTAYIHRVVESLWEEAVGRRRKPDRPIEDEALEIVRAMESGELTDTREFIRSVHNNCIFHGLPEGLRPKLD